MVFPWPSQAEKTWIDLTQCFTIFWQVLCFTHSCDVYIYKSSWIQQTKKIKKEIEDTIKISKSTLTLTLLDLGYKYNKSGDNRRFLYDQRSVINVIITVRYASSIACSFNEIIWEIKWPSPGLLKLEKLE
jgi:hypothetical protein